MPNDVQDWSRVFARPSMAAAGSPFSVGTGTHTTSVAIDSDTHSLGIVFTAAQSNLVLTVVGNQSGALYLTINQNNTLAGAIYYSPVIASIDTSVTITTTLATASNMSVALIRDMQTAVAFQANQQYNVDITAAAANVPVLRNAANSSWFRNSNLSRVYFSFGNKASGNATALISAPGAGLSIYLVRLVYSWRTAAATVNGYWRDANNNGFFYDNAAAAGAIRPVEFDGIPLAANTAFQWFDQGSAAANASTADGMVEYTVN